MEDQRRATTVRLPVPLLEWLKVQALRQRCSVNDLIENALTEVKEREVPA